MEEKVVRERDREKKMNEKTKEVCSKNGRDMIKRYDRGKIQSQLVFFNIALKMVWISILISVVLFVAS